MNKNIEEREKSFKINEFLTVKLEKEDFLTLKSERNKKDKRLKTYIYVKGQLFAQCKFLLLNIPEKEFDLFDNINSIDEAAEKLDNSLEPRSDNDEKISLKISPEEEFWGHCSNIQAWAENKYDTRLLHSNLAFPLLKKLAEAGDPIAKRIFKEEIAKRFETGVQSVVSYLLLEKYIDGFSDDYFKEIANSKEIIRVLFELVNSEIKMYKFSSLYLFDKLYKHMDKKNITDFVNIIKSDKKYEHDIFDCPAALYDRWYYCNSYKLESIRDVIENSYNK